ncbi:iron chelate uptake ABC transporter family permease subunit [Dietzia aurantiaca]|uniref:FecCD family ABC transporter permease n=1 Tax=Dietzia aurantiaca TaxID=983873 RepID=UPI001E3939B0|nr:iron chelate uptake ABC transporter family permease subunit [Dietzia aurantiaca]MCD2262232.1 iron chelate uptake ABC transporter family permease subunit [Dietzia aurantiaca]
MLRSPGALAGLWLIGLLVLAVSSALVTTIGPSGLTSGDVLQSALARVTGGDSGLSRIQEGIIWNLRLPRTVMAALAGAGLALCGVILQSLLRNPLADPYILGISSGASTGAVLIVVLGIGAGAVGLTTGAFVGSLVAFGFVLLLAFASGGTTDRVVLAGVAATQLFSAMTSFVVYIAADAEQTRGVLFWLLGSLASVRWSDVVVCAVVVLAGLVVCLLHTSELDAFTFGQDAAASLGVNVARIRLVLMVVTALVTAVIVSTCGAIGFVGLVLPHAARALVGNRHRVLVPTAALMGAVFLVWIDAASRTVISPQELPVGVATALIGVPAFVVLLLRRGRTR